MNVLSLPDEMLNSVFKYLDCTSLANTRKMSKRVDFVSKGYGINLPRVKELSTDIDKLRKGLLMTFPDGSEKLVASNVEDSSDDLLEHLKCCIPKIRRVDNLSLSSLYKEYVFTVETAEYLMNSMKKINRLSLCSFEIMFDSKMMIHFLNQFRLRKLALIQVKFPNIKYFDEILFELELEDFALTSTFVRTPASATVNGLFKMCSRKVPKRLWICPLEGTATEIAELMEKVYMNYGWSTIHWKLEPIRCGDMDKNQIVKLFSNLKIAEERSIVIYYGSRSISLIVKNATKDSPIGVTLKQF